MTLVPAEEEDLVGFLKATLELSCIDVVTAVDATADKEDDEEEKDGSNDAIVRVGSALFRDPLQSCSLAMRKCCDKRLGINVGGVSENAIDSSQPTLPSLHGMRQYTEGKYVVVKEEEEEEVEEEEEEDIFEMKSTRRRESSKRLLRRRKSG